MSANKIKKGVIRDKVWNMEYHIYCGGTAEDISKRIGYRGEPLVDADGFVAGNCNHTLYLWVAKPEMSLVAHEITHMVNRIYSIAGARPPIEDDELDAHWRGWLTAEIWRIIK